MTTVDEFLRSVRSAFGELRQGAWLFAAGLLAILVAAVLTAVIRWWVARRRLRRDEDEALRTIGREHGLSEADINYLAAIARAAQVSPMLAITSIAVFERVTVEALAPLAATINPEPSSAFTRIRQIRTCLGFDRIPPKFWLLTTRELSPGDEVKVNTTPGEVDTVTEAFFSVLVADANPATQAKVALEIARPHDARYVLHVRLLGTDRVEHRRRLFLAHEEHPERIQLRRHVRVEVRRAVSLKVVAPANLGERKLAQGTMLDISAGGMSIATTVALPRGHRVVCSFVLAQGAVFNEIVTVVVGCRPVQAGFQVQMAFTLLRQGEQDRLMAAVLWHEQHAA